MVGEITIMNSSQIFIKLFFWIFVYTAVVFYQKNQQVYSYAFIILAFGTHLLDILNEYKMKTDSKVDKLIHTVNVLVDEYNTKKGDDSIVTNNDNG